MKEQKTKEAMAASLLRFLCRKPLNRITVNDIIQDCGTSRMTFYYHFTDIYDLAKWTCERETDRMIQDHASLKSWQNDFRLVLDTLRKNPEATYHIYHAVDHDTLAPYMHKVIIKLLCPILDELSDDLHISDHGKGKVAGFYSHAAVGMMEDWLRESMVGPPKAILDETAVLTKGVMRKSLENVSLANW